MKTDRKPDVSVALARANGNDQPPMIATPPTGAIRTQTPYQTAMAVQVARRMKTVETNVLFEAGQMRESWLYSWKVQSKDQGEGVVEGETIDAAMVLARCFGNCTCPVQLVGETPTHWTFESVFIDLETGFSVQRLYRQRKPTGSLGRMSRERAEDAAFSMGVSKAQRNAILKGMPQWLLEKARQSAKKAASDDVAKGPPIQEQIGQWRLWLQKKGITDERVAARIGHTWDEFTPDDVVTLKTIGNAIREGITTLDDEFPSLEPPAPPPDTGAAETPDDFDPLA